MFLCVGSGVFGFSALDFEVSGVGCGVQRCDIPEYLEA